MGHSTTKSLYKYWGPKKLYKQLQYYALYKYGSNEALYDQISLSSQPEQSITYMTSKVTWSKKSNNINRVWLQPKLTPTKVGNIHHRMNGWPNSISKAYEPLSRMQNHPLTNDLKVWKISTHPDRLGDPNVEPSILTFIHPKDGPLLITFKICGARCVTLSMHKRLSIWNYSTVFCMKLHYDKPISRIKCLTMAKEKFKVVNFLPKWQSFLDVHIT